MGANRIVDKTLNTVSFATDILALLEAIKNKSEDTISTRQMLQILNVAHLNLLYVPVTKTSLEMSWLTWLQKQQQSFHQMQTSQYPGAQQNLSLKGKFVTLLPPTG